MSVVCVTWDGFTADLQVVGEGDVRKSFRRDVRIPLFEVYQTMGEPKVS